MTSTTLIEEPIGLLAGYGQFPVVFAQVGCVTIPNTGGKGLSILTVTFNRLTLSHNNPVVAV